MKIHRIHNHPQMEKMLGVDEGHVIIDRELFNELLKQFGMTLPIEKEILNKYQKFVQHIKNHLGESQSVICTICNKTIDEINNES